MTDTRIIEVERTIYERYEVDVDEWFKEFEYDWIEFMEGDEPTDDDREEWITELAWSLAREESIGTRDGEKTIFIDAPELDVSIRKL